MTPQHPAAPETETDASGITQDEREALWAVIANVRDHAPRLPNDVDTEDIIDAILDSGWVHRLIAERVRVVEGERDAAREACASYEGCDRAAEVEAAHGRALVDLADTRDRAESAEAAHESLRAGVEALADHWKRVGGPDSPRAYGERLRALLLAGGGE